MNYNEWHRWVWASVAAGSIRKNTARRYRQKVEGWSWWHWIWLGWRETSMVPKGVVFLYFLLKYSGVTLYFDTFSKIKLYYDWIIAFFHFLYSIFCTTFSVQHYSYCHMFTSSEYKIATLVHISGNVYLLNVNLYLLKIICQSIKMNIYGNYSLLFNFYL